MAGGAVAFLILLNQGVRLLAPLVGIDYPQPWIEYLTIGGALVAIVAATYALPMAVKYVGFSLHHHALRTLAATADEILSKDNRPPVLYFRSFDDDVRQATFVRKLNAAPTLVVEKSAEHVLSEYLGYIGPVVAIGRPGEALPELGFARMYVEHEQWQSKVIDLIDRAALIVLRAGHSPGVLWETSQIVRRAPLHRVIVIIPSTKDFDYDKYRDQVRNLVAMRLPEFTESRIKFFPLGVRGIVRFGPDGNPYLCVLPEPGLPPPSKSRLPNWAYRFLAKKGYPWFRPATVDFSSLLAGALGPIFADHLLTVDDPAKQYDERMRPTTFDHVLRRFFIVLLVAIAAFFILCIVVLFISVAE